MVEKKGAVPQKNIFIFGSPEHPDYILGRQLSTSAPSAMREVFLLTGKEQFTILIAPHFLDTYNLMRQDLRELIESSDREISPEFILGAVDQIVKNYTD